MFYDALPVVIGSDFKTCIDPISATRASIPWRLNHFVEAVHVACFSLGQFLIVGFIVRLILLLNVLMN